ncbi:MAG: DUF4373 domain-containing protein [Prevotella sp.]|nr:DUF4373 domain-containing protein [Bacteroidales bacterium]MCM1068697.1 DUF4373 domain-containing protein [Prevotella sp.]
MARPTKNNAEYFTHDADMRNDVKVKALRRKYGHTGYAVWCFLLESLTDTDFFEIDFTEVNVELLSADYDVSPEQLTEIVEYCYRINLLQRSDDGQRLFSEAHKRRFSSLISKRERDRERLTTLISKRKQDKTSENANYRSDNMNYHSDNPHSKVKKSKVEKSKDIIYPYRDITALWNSICVSLPQVKSISEERCKKIKSRLLEMEFNNPALWLDLCKALFERIQSSTFLTGDNPKGWKASFDWIFSNGNNWRKVMEGNYDNEQKTNNNGNSKTTTDKSSTNTSAGKPYSRIQELGNSKFTLE